MNGIDVCIYTLFYTETRASRRVSSKTFVLVAIDEFVWPPLNIFTLQTRDIGKLKESMAINVFLFAFHQLLFPQIDVHLFSS